ncbi:hypothetical protein [Actinoplanes sp. NPDC049118]|uniref:hypothetical protein n=1 Tax=Actinoplanes sp. NPDC049118 TaxID=3155769 RepID=UPI003403E831
MQQRRLAAWVIIDGRAYGPDHDLPADIAARITNPRAWPPEHAGPPEPEPVFAGLAAPTWTLDATPAPEPESEPAPVVVPPDSDPASDGDGGGSPAVVPPPRSGKGSGAEAWRAYAAAVHVTVADDADRGDIIAACVRAGHLRTTDDAD